MKRLIVAVAAWVVLAESALAGPAEDQLKALEPQRSAAILSNDMVFLDALYRDDFKGMTATGFAVDKPTLMEMFKRDDPSTVFTQDQIEARILGDGTVAVTTVRLTGRDPAGQILFQQRLMHVYVREQGRWRMQLGQGTLIPEAQRQP